jgi:hypothetical protein
VYVSLSVFMCIFARVINCLVFCYVQSQELDEQGRSILAQGYFSGLTSIKPEPPERDVWKALSNRLIAEGSQIEGSPEHGESAAEDDLLEIDRELKLNSKQQGRRCNVVTSFVKVCLTLCFCSLFSFLPICFLIFICFFFSVPFVLSFTIDQSISM